MKATQFNVTEAEIIKSLGLSRETVVKLRADNLSPGKDFAQIGREICYAPSGIEKIRVILKKSAAAPDAQGAIGDKPPGVTLGDVALLNIKPGAAPLRPDATAGQAGSDQPAVIPDAVVTKIYPHNPQYLEALLGGQTITIRVNHNANFIPGMIIPSRTLTRKNAQSFTFVRRCPRARGKW